MGKKVLIGCIAIIGGVFLVFGIIVAYFVVSDFKQEARLDTELEEIYELSSDPENMNLKEINLRLNRVVTKDDYAVVEKAMKAYISDMFENNLNIITLLDDEALVCVLTWENYENDGPDFTRTKKYISRMRGAFQECKRNHKELLKEDKMRSYIENCALDGYYLDFYEERMGTLLEWDTDGSVEESLDFMLELMDVYEGVICFLSDNRESWKVEDGYITFENDELTAKYDSLLYELYEDDAYTEEVPPEDEGMGLIQLNLVFHQERKVGE